MGSGSQLPPVSTIAEATECPPDAVSTLQDDANQVRRYQMTNRHWSTANCEVTDLALVSGAVWPPV